tara:strand:- start:297 stop:614 length:318 start_codon:yes stop_codon:yes gene_type:complete
MTLTTNETQIKHKELGNTITETYKVLGIGDNDPTLQAYEEILEAATAVIEAAISDTRETTNMVEALATNKAFNEARALSEEMYGLIRTHKATINKVKDALGQVTR